MRNRELHKRLAALERALAPPPRVFWSEWQKLLGEDEYRLVWALAERGAPSAPCDDFAAWAGLCRDEHELPLLRRIEAVAAADPMPTNSSGWCDQLWEHMMDLQA
jgi:hypothetical protein